jgi:HAD superfamily phosphatase (TIGR01681 family)
MNTNDKDSTKKDYKSLINTKNLFVFDFDDTLNLHSVNVYEKRLYENKIINILKNLKKENKTLAIASHGSPVFYLKMLNIFDLFQFIILPFSVNIDDYKSGNFKQCLYGIQFIKLTETSAYIYPSKADMIHDILMQTNFTKEETVFFDNEPENIKNVNRYGVESILVDPLIGIPEL